MCHLLESIRFENGAFHNLEKHQERLDRSRKNLFQATNRLLLEPLLNHHIPENLKKNQTYKCRVVYAIEAISVEFSPYQKPICRILQCVYDDNIDYSHKFHNRQHINELLKQKANADDILIVKNGLITDTSIANIICFNGKRWLTPSFPLLAGCQRQLLLEQGIIDTAEIRPEDLDTFEDIRLINAMNTIEDQWLIEEVIR